MPLPQTSRHRLTIRSIETRPASRLDRLRDLLVDPLLQHGSWGPPTDDGVEVTLLPGVTDTTARIEIAEFTNDGLVRHASFIDLTGPAT